MLRQSLLFQPSRLFINSTQQLRSVHRNHPGHKKKAFAAPVKLDLPDSYAQEAVYPPVKPKFPPGEWNRNEPPKLAWHYFNEGQKFHSLKTIQERLSVMAYMNVQQTLDDLKTRRTRHYPIYRLSAMPKTPQMLEFSQYITKTSVQVDDNQSETECTLNKSVSPELYEMLKVSVSDAILLNFADRAESINESTVFAEHKDSYKGSVESEKQNLSRKVKASDHLLRNILNSIVTGLGSVEECGHLRTAQYGNDVEIKAYWKRCGYGEQMPRGAIGIDPDTIRYQFEDVATYQIKCDKPLKPLYKLDNPEVTKSKVPDYIYNPSNFKIFADHTLPMQVPGHWYGDKREFNFLTVLNTTPTLELYNTKFPDCNAQHDFDAIKSMAVTTGLAELTAQAYYLGFSMWKDLTYPLMGQYLLSNGQDFCIAEYQLNTLQLWNKAASANNLCNVSVSERLFELNSDNTEIKSFNDNLFKRIINVLSTKPVDSESDLAGDYSEIDHMIGGSALRPYLSVNNFEKQLSIRHQLLATSLYELVKYDKPMSYLVYRSETDPVTYRPQFPRHYDRFTYAYRDIVLDYYPRDYFGFKLVERMLKKRPKESEKYWDLKTPVFGWANVPPPDTNNIPRNIDLPRF